MVGRLVARQRQIGLPSFRSRRPLLGQVGKGKHYLSVQQSVTAIPEVALCLKYEFKVVLVNQWIEDLHEICATLMIFSKRSPFWLRLSSISFVGGAAVGLASLLAGEGGD